MFDSIHEECGVFGIYEPTPKNVGEITYLGLFALQHRGQESCGIAVCDDGVIRHHKGIGLSVDECLSNTDVNLWDIEMKPIEVIFNE